VSQPQAKLERLRSWWHGKQDIERAPGGFRDSTSTRREMLAQPQQFRTPNASSFEGTPFTASLVMSCTPVFS
jgi:hypothetical protein